MGRWPDAACNKLGYFGAVGLASLVVSFTLTPQTFSGYTAPVAVNVYGNDLNAIDTTARQVLDMLRGIPGATSVQIQSPPGLPQLAIELHRDGLERWGLDPVQVLDAIHTAYQATSSGRPMKAIGCSLAARFQRPLPIIFGILLAALANHAVAGLVGKYFGDLLSGPWLRWILVPERRGVGAVSR